MSKKHKKKNVSIRDILEENNEAVVDETLPPIDETGKSETSGEEKPGEDGAAMSGEEKPGEDGAAMSGEEKPGENEAAMSGEEKPGENEAAMSGEEKPGENEAAMSGEEKPDKDGTLSADTQEPVADLADGEGEPEEPQEELATDKKKLRRWQKVLIACMVALLVVGAGGYFAFVYFYGKMNYDDGSDAVKQEETFDKDENAGELNQLNPDDIQLDSAVGKEKDNDVINILLAGEEAIGDDRGRTDSIMIATLNMKDKRVRLTSIMRDSYVQIPGYSDNKINAAYHNGGIQLLKETIKVNFGIEVDGYVLVQFDSFENLIDALGGIDIELSEREVSYLNRTNYISDYTNHNLSVGMNHLNGNQALGYARVRYVEKGVYSGDFARTLRHRTVMKAIFDKYKEKSILELAKMVPELLPLVTTDLTKTQCVEYLGKFVQVREENPDLEMLNVPVEGAYRLAGVRGMSVVLLDDLAANVKAMQEFMYGDAKKEDKNKESTLTVGQ